ncbi:UDP-3-O-acyl-N-acetylglucosamine deacetylase [Pseudoruegeria sp. SK021]|uniref:UDP-3-O-acyl-N-acetylglucosamine deacetylase n=1 Tax=Pseudoruegeria sp. SK021 TaxID=1933035 RepID=UPI000A2287F1|nr:UDP-3-O-acyl-N-acetylglucosamine deacetylase [Pseudoruegeria sp. SK021]OSP54984.1 UDP-3-O-[3-hydroxymyristoyl] N-acetylglucosamine deacetylase [Pseudoruegeria sp. SK021]
MQTTLKTSVEFKGIGLHSGRPVRMTVRPAAVDHGIIFHRTDAAGDDAYLPALWHMVDQSPLCTKLRTETGVTVSTIEHLMAALAGLGVRNALIDIDGPEVPILDGSAAPFVRKILQSGLEAQSGASLAIKILRPVEVAHNGAVARLEPDSGLFIDFSIAFEDAAIGTQSRSLNMRNGAFVRTLCDSRTFCRQSDVDAMREAGLALGGTTANAVVFDGDLVVSPGGLRHTDEPVRHKMLDALGDLALAGAPILGRYIGVRAGHTMTNRLLRAVFADPTAYEIVECDPETTYSLPGAGVSQGDLALCA